MAVHEANGQLPAVILDMDGTLVDSNDAHAHAWVEALREAGHSVSFERIRPLIGMGGDKLLPEAIGLSEEEPEGERISERRGEIFREKYLPRLVAIAGAADLVGHLKAEGHRLAVASSAKGDELEQLLRIAGIEKLVAHRTSSSDADNSKPEPDIIHAALDRLGSVPDEAVMIGDTPYDVEAARRAGMDTIAFRCGGWDDKGLAGALAIYDGPADLLRRYADSPLARAAGERRASD
jgi:HAD superfamily hydrolase (TIGR01509 family)